MTIRSILIEAFAARCELVTTVRHDAETLRAADNTLLGSCESRRFPAYVKAPYAAAREAERVARECEPDAVIEVRFA